MTELTRIYWTRQGLRFAYALAVFWLVLAAYGVFCGFVSGPAFAAAFTRPNEAGPAILGQALPHLLAPVVLVLTLIVVAVVIRVRDLKRRDLTRRFDRRQRAEGMRRAGDQCELEAAFARRCSRPAKHGDHFYPWSKGGATSLQNFVAACAACNIRKRARIPSPFFQQRLERRRREYFPAGTEVAAGERTALTPPSG